MKTLTIKNFKNFKNFSINELKSVNLIVGKNNSGKSSLLEAISMIATEGDLLNIIQILEQRGESIKRTDQSAEILESISSLYTDFDVKSFLYSPIIIFNESSTLKLELKYSEQRGLNLFEHDEDRIQADALLFDKDGLPINALEIICNDHRQHQLHFANSRNRIQLLQSRPLYQSDRKYACEYVASTNTSSNNLDIYYDSIAMTSLDSELIAALNIIEPRISDINFLTNKNNSSKRSAHIRYKDNEKRFKLSSMGDGINRILHIILAMLNCKNGFLLIDELENGLHYSAQYKLWETIFALAERLNIQVFATTHSKDCVRSFASIAQNKDGKLIRLQNEGGLVRVISYDERDVLECVASTNIETR